MRRQVLIALGVLGAASISFQADSARADGFQGTVSDSLSGHPLPGVAVVVFGPGDQVMGKARTDSSGAFRIERLPRSSCSIYFSRLGYQMRHLDGMIPDSAGRDLTIALFAAPFVMDPVVVSASRRRESGQRASASATVIDRTRLEEAVSFTPVDVTRAATGMDFASKGLLQHTFATRGSRSVNSAALLVLCDYRYAFVPSLGLNISYLLAPVEDDLERIEFIRGPGAALYGPDSDRGVLHLITGSPLDAPGTTISLSGGERSVAQMSFRHAHAFNGQVAYKLSGQYFQGHDWEYSDSVEVHNRGAAIGAGADPETLRIGARDPDAERVAGEARVDWRPKPGTALSLTGGLASAESVVDLTPDAGGIQVHDWRYSYVQGQIKRGRLFANLLLNLSDSGDTYFLRNGHPVVDESSLWGVQLQHGAEFRTRTKLLYGVDLRSTLPRTGGTLHGRNEEDDTMSEIGGYLHSTSRVLSTVDVVAAVRADYHDRLNDLALSPRVGLVYGPADAHAVRLTYNHAFNSPSTVDLFADFEIAEEGPYGLRISRIPPGGLTFSDECGGMCMRSPFLGVETPIPVDATLTWPAIVAMLQAEGINLSGIPAPTGADVATDLAALDPNTKTYQPINANEVEDLDPLVRKATDSVELGYKGILWSRLVVGLDVHYTNVRNPTGQLYAGTPNAFYDRETLEAYLAGYMSPAEAESLAARIADIPMGTITPQEAGASADILLLTRQGGTYDNWGVDLAVEVKLTDKLWAGGNYSWTQDNVFRGVGAVGDVILGVPRNKGSLSFGYRDAESGLHVSATGRGLDAFPVSSGVYRGRVDGYFLLDLEMSSRLPFDRRLTVGLGVTNVLDHRHQEFVGAPVLGRLAVARLKASF